MSNCFYSVDGSYSCKKNNIEHFTSLTDFSSIKCNEEGNTPKVYMYMKNNNRYLYSNPTVAQQWNSNWITNISNISCSNIPLKGVITEGPNQPLINNDSILCVNEPNNVYRFNNNQLNLYPNPQVATAINPNWNNNIKIRKCNNIPRGNPLTMPASTPTPTPAPTPTPTPAPTPTPTPASTPTPTPAPVQTRVAQDVTSPFDQNCGPDYGNKKCYTSGVRRICVKDPTSSQYYIKYICTNAIGQEKGEFNGGYDSDAPLIPKAVKVSTNNKCGENAGFTKCPGNQCCNNLGECGGVIGQNDSIYCKSNYNNKLNIGSPFFDGDSELGLPTSISTNGYCGYNYNRTKCPENQCCNSNGKCGGTIGTQDNKYCTSPYVDNTNQYRYHGAKGYNGAFDGDAQLSSV